MKQRIGVIGVALLLDTLIAIAVCGIYTVVVGDECGAVVSGYGAEISYVSNHEAFA